jgi:hypothetical protein
LAVGEAEGGAIVGLGVTGVSVGDGVGEAVGAAVGAAEGDPVGDGVDDGRPAVGVAETNGLELVACAPQAATSTRIASTATRRRDIRGPPRRDSSTLRFHAHHRRGICRQS